VIVFTGDNGEEFGGKSWLKVKPAEHYSLNFQRPFSYLKAQLPEVEDGIKYVIPIILDKAAVKLGPWSEYHVLAQHLAIVFSLVFELCPKIL
jgi:hypothetical protein